MISQPEGGVPGQSMREDQEEKKIKRKRRRERAREALTLLVKRKSNCEIMQQADITVRMTPALFKDTS